MKWIASYAVWIVWILAFLALELPGYFRVVPWVTLSETSWHAEATYPVVRTILLGFLLGLLVHIVYRRPLWHAEAFGIAVATAARFFA